VNARGARAGRVGRRQDQLGDRGYRVALVRIEHLQATAPRAAV